jgi:hypothetical protein
MACEEGVAVQRNGGRVPDRAVIAHVVALEHLDDEKRATGTNHGIDCLEHVRIGVRRT